MSGSAQVDPPHRAARDQDVVAGREGQVPIVAEEVAAALVHEQQLVAVGIARQVIHRASRAPESDAHRCVAEELGARPRARCWRRSELREIERVRAQRPLEVAQPVGGWR